MNPNTLSQQPVLAGIGLVLALALLGPPRNARARRLEPAVAAGCPD